MTTPAALSELLQKQMDRKEFLRHTAAILIFAAGGGMIVQSILKGIKFGQNTESTSSGGYGASSYGGATVASANKQY